VLLEHGFQDMPSHRYGVELAPGDYANLRVSQEGADMSVALSSPSGQELVVLDNPSDRNGSKRVSVVAEAAGIYTFEVRPREGSDAVVGRYGIELMELRPATAEDRLRTEADWTASRAFFHLLEARPENLAQALILYGKALEIFRSLNDPAGQASTLYGIGLVRFIGNQPAEALAVFEQCRELWREVDDSRQEGRALNQIGRTRRLLGDAPRALAAFQEALPLARAAGDGELQGTLLHNLAKLHVSLGNLSAAVPAYEQAQEIYRSRNDPSGEAFIANALGEVYDQQGRPAEALESFERALSLARRLRLNLEAEALDKLGDLHQRLGQPHKALEYFLPALDKYGEARNFAAQGLVLFHLGSLLSELGEPDQGEELLQRALPLLRDPRDQARTRLALGQIASEKGYAANALRLTQEALAASRQLEFPAGEAEALRALGFLHLDRGAAQEARAALEQALQRFEQIDSVLGQAETRRGLGQAAAALGDFAAADRSFSQALLLARELGNTAEEARILAATARSQRARGDLAAARVSLEQSLDRLESLRSAIAGDDLRASHFAAQRQTYEEYVDLLLQLHRKDPSAGLEARAFEAAERARARGLLDFLGQAQVDLREGDPALLAEENRLRLEMNAKAALRVDRLRKPGKAAEVRTLDEDLDRLTTQYQIVEARLQASSPRYAGLREPEIDLSQIQRQVLDGETVLLEYFLAEPHSVLWLVTPETVTSFELPGRAEIETLARRVHEALGSHFPEGAAEERKDLAALSRMLIGPIQDRIAGKRLAIAADGALWYIPFAALPVPGSEVPLIVENEIVEIPSAAVLRELRRSRQGRPRPAGAVALLADPVFERTDARLQAARMPKSQPRADATVAQAGPPPGSRDVWSEVFGTLRQTAEGEAFERLPWSRQEAEAIAQEAAQRQVFRAFDFQASRELATSADLSAYRVIHFATHGILDTQHPQLSGLVLSRVNEQGEPRDGFLRLHDVYQLHLAADLVVLSGCETALGKNLRGEGIVGLTHGFFHAGASQVLASLWPVRDRATAELMRRFYGGMFRDGLSPSAALRQAQIGMWRERTWRGPFFWAAFVLQGDWREWGGVR
jgi:CHAT domain-containing protein/tetratricopeptide (TPR) repeat protein